MDIGTFQRAVRNWTVDCFGDEIAYDTTERSHRFLEEALELVQSTGVTKSEALQLVDYVFGRPVGEIKQEVGGVMVTLAALVNAHGLELNTCASDEICRVWRLKDKIRAKHNAKPKFSSLPGSAA